MVGGKVFPTPTSNSQAPAGCPTIQLTIYPEIASNSTGYGFSPARLPPYPFIDFLSAPLSAIIMDSLFLLSALQLDTHLLSSWWTDPFIIMKYPLSQVIFLVLMSSFSYINIVTSAYLWLVFDCIILLFPIHVFIFNKVCFLQIAYNWILIFFHLDNLCLLFGAFKPFTFMLIIIWLDLSQPSCHFHSTCSISSLFLLYSFLIFRWTEYFLGLHLISTIGLLVIPVCFSILLVAIWLTKCIFNLTTVPFQIMLYFTYKESYNSPLLSFILQLRF